jgi:hypothetical protein
MDPVVKARLVVVLSKWADNHPKPDAPALQFSSNEHPEGLSPRQIVEAIKADTEDGNTLMEMLDHAIKEFSEDVVFRGFELTTAKAANQARAQ